MEEGEKHFYPDTVEAHHILSDAINEITSNDKKVTDMVIVYQYKSGEEPEGTAIDHFTFGTIAARIGLMEVMKRRFLIDEESND